jgi:hypothetical protein
MLKFAASACRIFRPKTRRWNQRAVSLRSIAEAQRKMLYSDRCLAVEPVTMRNKTALWRSTQGTPGAIEGRRP